MQKPDANGYINVTWPSKNVPHGGIFHTRVAQASEDQRQFLKLLLEESKLTLAQRKKYAYNLRQEDEIKAETTRRPAVCMVRPRTSRRRSLSSIRESGAFEVDLYKPPRIGVDRDRMKEKLANTMAYGDNEAVEIKPPAKITGKSKPAPKLPTSKETWHDLVGQIRERAEWLAEMEYLGHADPHREIIKDQIAERMRLLDTLGIDSECSTARSTASGFSTLRSTEKVETKAPKPVSATKSMSSNGSAKSKEKAKQGSARYLKNIMKDENVASYEKLSPLQYSPRRRM